MKKILALLGEPSRPAGLLILNLLLSFTVALQGTDTPPTSPSARAAAVSSPVTIPSSRPSAEVRSDYSRSAPVAAAKQLPDSPTNSDEETHSDPGTPTVVTIRRHKSPPRRGNVMPPSPRTTDVIERLRGDMGKLPALLKENAEYKKAHPEICTLFEKMYFGLPPFTGDNEPVIVYRDPILMVAVDVFQKGSCQDGKWHTEHLLVIPVFPVKTEHELDEFPNAEYVRLFKSRKRLVVEAIKKMLIIPDGQKATNLQLRHNEGEELQNIPHFHEHVWSTQSFDPKYTGDVDLRAMQLWRFEEVVDKAGNRVMDKRPFIPPVVRPLYAQLAATLSSAIIVVESERAFWPER